MGTTRRRRDQTVRIALPVFSSVDWVLHPTSGKNVMTRATHDEKHHSLAEIRPVETA
jgi:hypothetical protein